MTDLGVEKSLSSARVLADGLDHPEGVTWGPDGNVYAGGEAGQIYRIAFDSGEVTQVGSTGGFVLGVVTDADANVYACDMVRRAVIRVTPGGEASVYSTGTAERPMICPNAAVFAADGTLYVSDSGDWEAANGGIWLVRPGGETELLTDEVRAHSNGLALDPAGRYLYCVESLRPAIMRVPLGPDGRAAGPAEVALALTPEIVADGIAFDSAGSMLIACYAPSVIYRVDATQRMSVLARDPHNTVLAAPTNVVFAGPALTTLVVASLARWHLTRFELDAPGAPLNYPEVSR